jgi:hypothetical protein
MTKTQQLIWKWQQPRFQGMRIVMGLVINVSALVGIVWLMAKVIG